MYLGPKNYKVFTFLDSRASACFIDQDFVKKYEISLIQKIKSIYLEVLDDYFSSFGDVIYEIIPIDVAINDLLV